MDYRVPVSILVVILTFAGYIPYVADILKGRTKPHAYTWLAASLTAFLAYGLQSVGGAGVGALPMLVIAVICTIVFILSLRHGTKDITKSDLFALIASLIGLVLWVFIKQPVLSVIIITCSEILSYVPTIRKSWLQPYSETLALYEISMVRHGLSIVALEQINILTTLYPTAWTLTNVVITLVLIIRRKRIAEST